MSKSLWKLIKALILFLFLMITELNIHFSSEFWLLIYYLMLKVDMGALKQMGDSDLKELGIPMVSTSVFLSEF